MSSLIPVIGILFWMVLGAAVGIALAGLFVFKDVEPDYAPHAELLGKPCWMNEGGDYSKFRVVAVSHKGSVAIRRWDDYSGKHAKWIGHQDIEKGNCLYFDLEEV